MVLSFEKVTFVFFLLFVVLFTTGCDDDFDGEDLTVQLHGQIVTFAGDPVANTQIDMAYEIIDGPRRTFTFRTDKQGNFLLEDFPVQRMKPPGWLDTMARKILKEEGETEREDNMLLAVYEIAKMGVPLDLSFYYEPLGQVDITEVIFVTENTTAAYIRTAVGLDQNGRPVNRPNIGAMN